MDNAVFWIHVAAGWLVVAAALATAVFGLLRRNVLQLGGPSRSDRLFTQLTALSQTLVVGCGFIGLLLLSRPGGPDDPLHTKVYGPFMLAAFLGAYSYRTADRRRNVIVFSVAAIFVAALGVRALTTG